jgi:CBS domain-containing protein
VVLDVGVVPTHLFVIIKGYVTQTEGDEVLATYGPDDCFDGCGLMTGRVGSRFVAAEEVVAYQLAREAVNELIARNTTFGALLFSDLVQKLSALSRSAQRPARAAVAHPGARRPGVPAPCAHGRRRYRHCFGGAPVPGAAHHQCAGARG